MGESAFIIHPHIKGKTGERRSVSEELQEITSLVEAINLQVLKSEAVSLNNISPSQFFGKGTAARFAEECEQGKADVVIVNHTLSPVQQRNLEQALNTKVIDRTGLILEIFGERASTKEGRIQVELAALEYQKSRLVRSWTHLERQRGGAGFMGGPGETQIEIDRRLIAQRITRLKKELSQVKKTRELGRKARERVPFPIIALVGYTNAGKSTLFNHLTNADVMAEDLLFATLDPTMRKMRLPDGKEVILADTVGFISDLPTSLIAAFRSTLEQVDYADVILHVRDIAREDTNAQQKDVIEVLEDLNVDYEHDERIIEVWNKIDILEQEDKEVFLNKALRKNAVVCLSAETGEGMDELLETITDLLSKNYQQYGFILPYEEGEALSWLYTHGTVEGRQDLEDAIHLNVYISQENKKRFAHVFNIRPMNDETDPA